jgi:hypothetical protein
VNSFFSHAMLPWLPLSTAGESHHYHTILQALDNRYYMAWLGSQYLTGSNYSMSPTDTIALVLIVPGALIKPKFVVMSSRPITSVKFVKFYHMI